MIAVKNSRTPAARTMPSVRSINKGVGVDILLLVSYNLKTIINHLKSRHRPLFSYVFSDNCGAMASICSRDKVPGMYLLPQSIIDDNTWRRSLPFAVK